MNAKYFYSNCKFHNSFASNIFVKIDCITNLFITEVGGLRMPYNYILMDKKISIYA